MTASARKSFAASSSASNDAAGDAGNAGESAGDSSRAGQQDADADADADAGADGGNDDGGDDRPHQHRKPVRVCSYCHAVGHTKSFCFQLKNHNKAKRGGRGGKAV